MYLLREAGYPAKMILDCGQIFTIYLDWSKIKIRTRLSPRTVKMKVSKLLGYQEVRVI